MSEPTPSTPPPASDEADRSKETTPGGVEHELERLAEAEGATRVPQAAELPEIG